MQWGIVTIGASLHRVSWSCRYLFHNDHFLCFCCEKPIKAEESFFIHPKLDKPYHESCYEENYLTKCALCHRGIGDGQILNVIASDGTERPFHVDCFKCGIDLNDNVAPSREAQEKTEKQSAGCEAKIATDQDLSNLQFFIQNDRVYCEPCYDGIFIPECDKCHRRIKNELSAVTPDPMDAEKPAIRYFVVDEKPCCQVCYDDLILPTCSRCHAKIRKSVDKDGRPVDIYLTIGSDKYHQTCFCCFDCNKPFEDLKAFVLEGNQYYCQEHYDVHAREAKAKHAEQ